jgi:proline iminopeptidase
MATFEHAGATLWYETVGTGELLVVLHGGLGLDHTCLRPWLDPLAETFRLAFLDFRANGRSTGAVGPGTMRSLADDVDALREHLGAERAFLLGHSYGGFVAQEHALTYPDRVAGLVLCDTDSRGPRAELMMSGLERLGADPGVMDAFAEQVDTTEDLLRLFDRMGPYYLPHSSPTRGREVMARTVFRREGSALGGAALDGWDVTSRLPEISTPALVLTGADDFMFPPEVARSLAEALPAGRAVVIDGAGHLPFVEQQQAFLDGVRTWAAALA